MNAIGGYFELELRKGERPHKEAVALNTGKNCLEFLLRHKHYSKVYVPAYTCEVVYLPFEKLHIPYALYGVDRKLEPVNLPDLKEGEAFLYTNYFGLKQDSVERLAKKYGERLIVDNAQAYYASPVEGVNTYYSPRKFMGIPDGGFLYMTGAHAGDAEGLEQSTSYDRVGHLVKRIDLSAEEAYADFKTEDESLADEPVMRMSKLTMALLGSVDDEMIKHKRRTNYQYLHERLGGINKLSLTMDEKAVPMVYPLYVENAEELRKKLVQNKIYCATYWPNVLESCAEDSIDYKLTKNILHLPIDQRYDEEDMERIVEIIKCEI